MGCGLRLRLLDQVPNRRVCTGVSHQKPISFSLPSTSPARARILKDDMWHKLRHWNGFGTTGENTRYELYCRRTDVGSTQAFCPGKRNQYASYVLTGGIYTPMTVIVTCAAADMSSAAVDSASVVTVPYGSDYEEIMDAFGQAADKAVAAEQPAYVQFKHDSL